MWIIENKVQMRPGHPFYCSLVLKAEVDSKSSWTGPPACLRSCWSFSPPHLSPCTSRPSPMFLSKITSLGSNLFSKLWKGSLRNELTSKFNHCSRARVVGPCIMVGGSTGATKGVMPSSPGCGVASRGWRAKLTAAAACWWEWDWGFGMAGTL